MAADFALRPAREWRKLDRGMCFLRMNGLIGALYSLFREIFEIHSPDSITTRLQGTCHAFISAFFSPGCPAQVQMAYLRDPKLVRLCNRVNPLMRFSDTRRSEVGTAFGTRKVGEKCVG